MPPRALQNTILAALAASAASAASDNISAASSLLVPPLTSISKLESN